MDAVVELGVARLPQGHVSARLVTPWVRFTKMSTGVNVARRLSDQREDLREAYQTVHGSDPAKWPTRHPGIVIDAVQWVAHAACLGCQWIDVPGTSMSDARGGGKRPPQ